LKAKNKNGRKVIRIGTRDSEFASPHRPEKLNDLGIKPKF
jgi:hypothetical protein